MIETQRNFWRGKRVLLTGHTGFKGSWLTVWLARLGARVTGLSLPPVTEPNLFNLAGLAELCESHFCDIRNYSEMSAVVRAAAPQVVLHMAAQPLVRASYREPVKTFSTNVMGTVHLLEALRGLDSVKVVVLVTTDKVYQNAENSRPYNEEDRLGGIDPYSASKAASELVIASYRDAFLSQQGVSVASARAGNVIGGGDWSEDRLFPDALSCWLAGSPLEIRNPESVRPWQHVLDPLYGYLSLAQKMWSNPELGGAFNFGPEVDSALPVSKVIELARRYFGEASVKYGNNGKGPHEAGLLILDIEKAHRKLGVKPRTGLTDAIKRTVDWYTMQFSGADARELCLSDIVAYEGCE